MFAQDARPNLTLGLNKGFLLSLLLVGQRHQAVSIGQKVGDQNGGIIWPAQVKRRDVSKVACCRFDGHRV
jgi:hypothetical protein